MDQDKGTENDAKDQLKHERYTDIQTDRHRHRYTDTDTQTQTHRHRHRHRHRHETHSKHRARYKRLPVPKMGCGSCGFADTAVVALLAESGADC